MNVTVVMPSRGRPERALVAVQALRDTAALVSTSIILAIDEDDREWQAYQGLNLRPYGAEVNIVTLRGEETGSLVRATNTVTMRVVAVEPDAIVGNLGDDHIARTPGWDKAITDALREPGIAYGDDLLQHEHLPTAPFISGAIIRALGWFFLPTLDHLYGDDGVKRIGRATGCLRYLPDVVIEHEHPAVGKAAWDEGYIKANGPETTGHDLAEYKRWLKSDTYNKDIANVQRALAKVAA